MDLATIRSILTLMLVIMAVSLSMAWAENAGSTMANTSMQGQNATSKAPMNATTANVTGPAVTLGMTAQNIAFNTSTITVPAGANVTIIFNNMDAVPHNIAFYQTSALNGPIYKGAIITGPKTITYHFTAPSKPGTYYFQCDVHPSMNGRFVVK